MKELKVLNKYPYHLLLIILSALNLRMYNIAELDLWRDEAFSVNGAMESIPRIIEIAVNDTQPPLHMLLLNIWMQFFGEGEYSVRFLSLLFGMLTVYLTIKIAETLFGKGKIAILAGVFAATSPLFDLLFARGAGI